MSVDSPPTSPASAAAFSGRLARSALLLLIPLTLLPVILMGTAAYFQARSLLLNQANSQLISQHQNHIDELERWELIKRVRLARFINYQAFETGGTRVLSIPPTDPAFADARETALEALQQINQTSDTAIFNNFIIVNDNGRIIASTVRDWEGVSIANEAFYFYILSGENESLMSYAPAPMYPDELVVFTAKQLRNRVGEHIGAVIGITEASAISRAIHDSPFQTDDVDHTIITATDNTYLDSPHDAAELVVFTPSSEQFTQLGNLSFSENEIYQYQDQHSELVAARASWLPSLNIGFTTKIPQAQLVEQINTLAPFTLLLVGGTLVLAGLLVWVGTRSLTNPVSHITEATQAFAEGDWTRRAEVTRDDEVGLLAHSFNQMAEQLSDLYGSLQSRVDQRTDQIITASQIAQAATSANSLDTLLNRTVNLIVERFHQYHAAIFLIDEAGENAVLYEATGPEGRSLKAQGYKIPTNSPSIISWVSRNNTPRVVSNTATDDLHLKHELLQETRSELAVPITSGDQVIGVLDIQNTNVNVFEAEFIEVLQTIASQVGTAIQNFRLLEGTEVSLQEISVLYGGSRKISQAQNADEIFQIINQTVQETTFISAVYLPRGERLALVVSEGQQPSYSTRLPSFLNISAERAQIYLNENTPTIIRDINQPTTPIHAELLAMPQEAVCEAAAYIAISYDGNLKALMIIGSTERGMLTQGALQPYLSLSDMAANALQRVQTLSNTEANLKNLEMLNSFSEIMATETSQKKIYAAIHQRLNQSLGEVDFFVALYDADHDRVSFPYAVEENETRHIEDIPLGEGLSSLVINNKEALLLVEDMENQATAMGAVVVGNPAKSWMGVPLIVADEVIGLIGLQDAEKEKRFNREDLQLVKHLATQVAGAIRSVRLVEESQRRASQLQTAADIAREASTSLDLDELLRQAVYLVLERFNFYHASVFLMDSSNEYAYVRESTGEAGRQLLTQGHRLAVGSQSVIGYVTEHGEPLVVNDVVNDPIHRFNPLLPETAAELGIPMMIGERVLGALDVQSTEAFSFTSDDVEVLQILADQLAVAVVNAQLFADTQTHLAQHRLIHEVTTVAASSTRIEESLESATQGLRETLGDQVAILLLDAEGETLQVAASSGYDQDVLGMQIPVGEGTVGIVASERAPRLVIGRDSNQQGLLEESPVQSILAVPLIYRNELVGVLNVESEEKNAFNEQDRDILTTLSGSLSAIIVNARLTERQRRLFDITSKIRRSVDMQTILQTTASELSKAVGARRTHIEVGLEEDVDLDVSESENDNTQNGKESDAWN
ncbi:MAG: GAF domain-containing protein [Chloroflexi bacterium]|nr:MAG: GAF domain-containing protein [Chloroflexota bacterium]MBL1194101.1 GAF domain-containing protein [Chloroflexota bacterium]NOH11395.1 GAF domain-containing protein [Chloroflexota bacterium]